MDLYPGASPFERERLMRVRRVAHAILRDFRFPRGHKHQGMGISDGFATTCESVPLMFESWAPGPYGHRTLGRCDGNYQLLRGRKRVLASVIIKINRDQPETDMISVLIHEVFHAHGHMKRDSAVLSQGWDANNVELEATAFQVMLIKWAHGRKSREFGRLDFSDHIWKYSKLVEELKGEQVPEVPSLLSSTLWKFLGF